MTPNFMQIIVAILFILNGAMGVFKPDFFYNRAKLKPKQIARNKRVWNCVGALLIVLGVLDLISAFVIK